MTKRCFLSNLLNKKYGEGEDDTLPGGKGGDPKKDDAGEKKFDQAAVNLFVSREKAKYEKQLNEAKSLLNKTLEEKGMSDEQRTHLEERLAELENMGKSKEELSKIELEKKEKKYTEQLTNVSKEKETWQQRYTQMKHTNDVVEALGGDAFNPTHIVEMLKGKLKLSEDGMNTRVKFTKDGTELDLSPKEAIELMKNDPSTYGYLFRSTVKSGTGGNNVGTPTQTGQFAGDHETFRKQMATVLGRK